jgi:hypothetical protein
MMDVPALVRRHCKNESNRLHPRHRRKGFFVVNPWLLDISLSDKPCSVLDNMAEFIFLRFKDPFQAYRSMPMRQIDDILGLVVFN